MKGIFLFLLSVFVCVCVSFLPTFSNDSELVYQGSHRSCIGH